MVPKAQPLPSRTKGHQIARAVDHIGSGNANNPSRGRPGSGNRVRARPDLPARAAGSAPPGHPDRDLGHSVSGRKVLGTPLQIRDRGLVKVEARGPRYWPPGRGCGRNPEVPPAGQLLAAPILRREAESSEASAYSGHGWLPPAIHLGRLRAGRTGRPQESPRPIPGFLDAHPCLTRGLLIHWKG